MAAAAPSQGNVVEDFAAQVWEQLPAGYDLETAIVLVPLGLAFLLYGFRMYRWLVVVAYAAVGAVAGLMAAQWFGVSGLVCGILGAIVLGILAWPLHRLGWGLLGGGLFGAAAVGLAGTAGVQGQVLLALIGTVAFLGGMLLTMLVMKPIIILVTSVLGASALAAGVVRLLELWPAVGNPVGATFRTKPYLPALAIAILAAVGLVLQVIDTGAAGRKKSREQD
jgi:hypothetical protein